jgi:hypothetical protein
MVAGSSRMRLETKRPLEPTTRMIDPIKRTRLISSHLQRESLSRS